MDWKQAEWASKTRWHSGLAKKNYWQMNQQTLWQNALEAVRMGQQNT
jgi:hypothetical protein